jgi:two-component system, cell cycle response regulator DivK
MNKNYTVLYIDDNSDNRTLIERFLNYEGFKVYSADTGQEGLAQAAAIKPDIFLIDLNLPDMNGYEVLNALNDSQETQSIPKIIFSANDLHPAEKKSAVSHYFIQKPLDISTLSKKLEYAIQHPQARPGSQL